MTEAFNQQFKEYKYLCRNLPDAMLILSRSSQILIASKTFDKLTGYSQKELIEKKLLDLPLLPKEYSSYIKENIKKILAGKEAPLYDIEITTKTGKKIIVEINSRRIKYKGKYTILLILRDVSKQKNLERAIEESENRLRSLLESTHDAVISINNQGNIIFWNKGAKRIFGYSENEIINKPLVLLIPERFRKDFKKQMEQLLSTGKSKILGKIIEMAGLKKDGSEFYAEQSISSWKIGENLFFTSIVRDISKRKKTEKDLIEKSTAIESSINAIAFTDIEENITYVNPSFLKLWGYNTAKEVLGKSITKFWEIEEKAQEIIRGLNKKGGWIGELTAKRKDGSLFDVALSTTIVKDSTGNPITIMGSFIDITEQKKIDRAKTEFISLASHQLRTPLATMNWYLEMLLSEDNGKINTQQKKYLEEAYTANHRLVKLVNALLNVSRIELGTLIVKYRPTNFIEISDSVLDEFSVKIKDKKIKIERNYDKKLPIIKSDPYMIEIIFQNLVSNAVQYTPKNGRVSIEIKKQKSDILIKVADTGYGVPKAQQAKIFEKLFRASNIKEREPDGTGLGLYIVKAVIEQSGGKIWFDSVENKGSTFYVTIPLKVMKKKLGTR